MLGIPISVFEFTPENSGDVYTVYVHHAGMSCSIYKNGILLDPNTTTAKFNLRYCDGSVTPIDMKVSCDSNRGS